MLNKTDSLALFFEDCYLRIGVREYSRKTGVSPPTASKILSSFVSEGLLKCEEDRQYKFYFANTNNRNFVLLSLIYWNSRLSNLIRYLDDTLLSPVVVLFGSLSKGEVRGESDIDIAIFSSKKNLDFSNFEKNLGRKIEVFWFNSLSDIKNLELRENIINGFILLGRFKL